MINRRSLLSAILSIGIGQAAMLVWTAPDGIDVPE
jgi:hypothetical protein